MQFFTQAVTVLQTLVIALGAGLCIWGGINLMEGYGADNPGAKSQGIKQVMCLWRWYDFLTGRFLTALEFLICIPDFADKSIINLNRHYLIPVLVRLLVNDNFFNQRI